MVATTTAVGWWARIFVGLRVGYSGECVSKATVLCCVRDFVNSVQLCVTVEDTDFYYVDGADPGVVVGMISYPRFPRTVTELEGIALRLAGQLKDKCYQNRVTILFPSRAVMIGD